MKTVEIKVPEGYELKQEGNTYTIVEEEFKLEVGGDYVSKGMGGIVIDRRGTFRNSGFWKGSFSNSLFCKHPHEWRKATEEEVIEAFEKECVRRLGENWRDIEIKESMVHGNNFEGWSFVPRIVKTNDGWQVWGRKGCLYSNGKWAEALEEPKFADSLEEIDRRWGIDVRLPTTELVEGTSALTQLLSFRHDVWEKEGKPNDGEIHWCIGQRIESNKTVATQTKYSSLPFKFKKEETAEYFLKKHKELLTEYFNKIIK